LPRCALLLSVVGRHNSTLKRNASARHFSKFFLYEKKLL
jgi:hypothetical protein